MGEDALLQLSKKNIVLFFLIGFLGNVLLIAASHFVKDILIKYWIIIYNTSLIIANILPFGRENDVNSLIKYIREKENQ